MLIRRLVLENFGLFRGRNEIDLAPRTRYGKVRPVILIGGKNGSGKTTLLEALRLCLYGPLAIGVRGGGRKYEEHLIDRIHRVEGALFQLPGASVAMEFEYAQAGVRHAYWVERRWERGPAGAASSLTVLRDGRPLDELDRAHADEFLRDLVPPGVSQLFFFDGEKIQQLAETDQDHAAVAEAIRGLLGLEIIDRLRGDLRIYAGRLKQAPHRTALEAELAALLDERQSLEACRREASERLDDSNARRDRLKQDVAREEQRLTQRGGGFASRRDALKTESEQLQQAIRDAEGELREMCEGLLPFMLATSLCRRLGEQLDAEAKVQRWQAHEALLRRRLEGMKAGLEQAIFPQDEGGVFSVADRANLTSRLTAWLDRLLDKPPDLPDAALIHRLSEEDRAKLQGAIATALNETPRRLCAVQKKLEKGIRRLREVERAIEKVPADEELRPMLGRIRQLQEELGQAHADVKSNDLAVKGIDLQLDDRGRRERKLQDKVADAARLGERAAMAVKAQAALEEYAQALATAKVDELRDAVVRCFARLWRKGDLVRRIDLNPADFAVTLFDRHDRVVPKKQLSAGEKQIYAISLLWALAQVSGRPLPMVIDTPLGRLDSEHRRHLVERYFPHASHQVVIFSTDTEIDRTYFRDLGPAISHAYQLLYDQDEGKCTIEKGYFWAADEKGASNAG